MQKVLNILLQLVCSQQKLQCGQTSLIIFNELKRQNSFSSNIILKLECNLRDSYFTLVRKEKISHDKILNAKKIYFTVIYHMPLITIKRVPLWESANSWL